LNELELVAALEGGRRLPLERLAEAAGRIERLAAWLSGPRAVDCSAGSGALARHFGSSPHEHTLAELLGPGADGRLVMLVRDAQRHDWATSPPTAPAARTSRPQPKRYAAGADGSDR
jgi:hypothetical protein